ncbi:TPA: hypothetical protein ACGPPQ_002910, partial [Pseudomonas aeruginosa]
MLSDKEIKDCEWSEDEIINHFYDFISQKIDGCDWIDIGREGTRLVSLLIRDDIEEDSHIDVVITTVSAASEELAYSRIASAFGMTKDEFEISLDKYLSSDIELSLENFSKFC